MFSTARTAALSSVCARTNDFTRLLVGVMTVVGTKWTSISSDLLLDIRHERHARVWLAYAVISAIDVALSAASAQLDQRLGR